MLDHLGPDAIIETHIGQEHSRIVNQWACGFINSVLGAEARQEGQRCESYYSTLRRDLVAWMLGRH